VSKLLKVGLALVLIGLGLVIALNIVIGSNNFDFYGDEQEYVFHEETLDLDSFSVIIADLENRKISITPSEDDQVHISYYASEADNITFTSLGDTLTVESVVKWYRHFMFNMWFFQSPTVYLFSIELPEEMIISTVLETSNGQIDCSDLTFDSLTLDTSNGDIDLENVIADDMTISTSNGALSFTNVLVNGTIDGGTSNGRITSEGLSAENIELSTSNGNVTLNNVTADDLDCYTSNSSITLNLSGTFDDYSLSMTTSNGKYYLNGDQVITNSYHDLLPNKIVLISSNGNISVNFSN